jgi:hypothetical protein
VRAAGWSFVKGTLEGSVPMAELKIKIELNKGRIGVPLERLAKVADEARKFLEMFAKDIELGEGQWIAEHFTNDSVAYDASFIGEASERALRVGHKALRHLTDPKRTPDDLGYGIRRETLFQFGKMASPLPEDDALIIGLYNGKPQPETRILSKKRFLVIERQIVEKTTHYGGLQGVITALFKGSSTIWVHDLSTGAKVVCEFSLSDYGMIWELLKSRDTVVNVEGWITKKPGEVNHLKIETITPAAEYQAGDLEKFFGIDPDFTGEMSTDEYLDDLRGDTTEDYLRRLPDE